MNDEAAHVRARLEQAPQDDAGESAVASEHEYLRCRVIGCVHMLILAVSAHRKVGCAFAQ